MLKKEENIIFTDIWTEMTERENQMHQYTKELEESNAAKDKFFSIISHDLKNMFDIVLNYSHTLIEKGKEMNENRKELFIKTIYESSLNTYNLFENLRVWSNTQRNCLDYKPEHINLEDLINQNMELFINQAKMKNIDFSCKCNDDYYVYGDINMLNTVLRNLISNAIKFTLNSGRVFINASSNDNAYKVSVTDTGIGISKENISKLFRIEEKCTQPGTNDEKGTGLGLIICKEFIKKHKGQITVESKVGEGSTFNFTIPNK